jgi:uncharacterized protein (TIGR03435 family)
MAVIGATIRAGGMAMTRLPLLVALLAVAVLPLTAQTPPRFEVASVKVNTSGDGTTRFGPQPGGRFAMTNGPLRLLLAFAYVPEQREILGLPDWADTARYDVTAKGADAASAEDMRVMVRSLLADRFGLRLHYEMRDRDVYRLVRLRDDGTLGPQLRPVDVDCNALRDQILKGQLKQNEVGQATNGVRLCVTSGNITKTARGWMRSMKSGGSPISALLAEVGQRAGRVIVNETNLTGFYEYTLEYAGEDQPDASDLPSIFTALQEQLGLRLVPDRRAVEVIVIDSVSRPTPD